FEKRYRREFRNFYEFLSAFYDMHHHEDSYFWKARKVLNSQETAQQAFVSLVAGVSNLQDEHLFVEPGRIEKIKEELEQLDDNTSSPYQFAEKKAFLNVLVEEATQIQTQASVGSRRASEEPIFEGGLIPSADGFRWREATASLAATK